MERDDSVIVPSWSRHLLVVCLKQRNLHASTRLALSRARENRAAGRGLSGSGLRSKPRTADRTTPRAYDRPRRFLLLIVGDLEGGESLQHHGLPRLALCVSASAGDPVCSVRASTAGTFACS